MKTNQILRSTDRELFGIRIRQQTKTQLLCVSDLQKAYDIARWQYGWSSRTISDITKYKAFSERVYHILKELGLIKMTFITFTQLVDNESITKVLKGLKVWQTKGRGSNKATYCNPYIWVLLAMELNPMIYAKVVIWLTDTLIKNRIFAGDKYKPMNIAINSIVDNPNYSKYARLLNDKIFGFHEKGIRNYATSQQLEKMGEIEQFIAESISMGFIKNEKDVIRAIKNHSATPLLI